MGRSGSGLGRAGKSLAAAAVLLLAAGPVWGAEHRGVVRASSLAVPGATVTATCGEAKVTVTTDEDGAYRMEGLADGTCRIEVAMPGFTTVARDVTLPEETPLELEIQLLTADGQAPGVETAPAMRSAPPSRPGPAAGGAQLSADFPALTVVQTAEDAAAGAGDDLEGVTEEMALSAAEALAVAGRAGRTGGGVARRYNFSAGLTLNNSAFDARRYSVTGEELVKPAFAAARANVSLGGPLVIPGLLSGQRTQFSFNYSRSDGRSWRDFTATMPSPLERGGDFTQSVAEGPVRVHDPASGLPFPGNRIPASRVDPAAAGLLEFVALPTHAGLVRNYQFVTAVPRQNQSVNGSVNQRLGRRHRLSTGFSYMDGWSDSPQLMGFVDTFRNKSMSGRVNWTHVLKPGVVGTARAEFRRNRSGTEPFFAFRENTAARLGIQGTSQDPRNWGPPNLSFTNFGGLYGGSFGQTVTQNASVSELMTVNRQKHSISFGVEYASLLVNRVEDLDARGSFVFTGLQTSALDAAGTPVRGTGFDFADFLLGLPQSSRVRFGAADAYMRSHTYGLFVQDDWRVGSRFTLKYGVRYDYASPVREKWGRMGNLDVAPFFADAAVVTPGAAGPFSGTFPETLVDPDRNNVSPRVAIAWKPRQKVSTVIRAGYGVYYNSSVYSAIANRLVQQPPFASSLSLASTADGSLTIRDGFGQTATTEVANTYAVDRNYRIGYAQSWNVSVSQQLGRTLSGEVSYIGTKGTLLDMLSIPNQAPLGVAGALRPIAGVAPFIFETSDGHSIYHSGNARLARRMSRGISAEAVYAFGRSIDNASSVAGGGGSGIVVQDAFNFAAERGLSSFDKRHSVTGSMQVATGRAGETFWVRALLSNWMLSFPVTWRTGLPLTATVLGNLADIAGAGVTGSNRADATGLPSRAGEGFFNLAAFALPPADRFGNAGRGTITGPSMLIVSGSVARRIPLRDRLAAELRADAANVLNHVNITNLGTVVNASNYGLALGAGGMRAVTLSFRVMY